MCFTCFCIEGGESVKIDVDLKQVHLQDSLAEIQIYCILSLISTAAFNTSNKGFSYAT